MGKRRLLLAAMSLLALAGCARMSNQEYVKARATVKEAPRRTLVTARRYKRFDRTNRWHIMEAKALVELANSGSGDYRTRYAQAKAALLDVVSSPLEGCPDPENHEVAYLALWALTKNLRYYEQALHVDRERGPFRRAHLEFIEGVTAVPEAPMALAVARHSVSVLGIAAFSEHDRRILLQPYVDTLRGSSSPGDRIAMAREVFRTFDSASISSSVRSQLREAYLGFIQSELQSPGDHDLTAAANASIELVGHDPAALRSERSARLVLAPLVAVGHPDTLSIYDRAPKPVQDELARTLGPLIKEGNPLFQRGT